MVNLHYAMLLQCELDLQLLFVVNKELSVAPTKPGFFPSLALLCLKHCLSKVVWSQVYSVHVYFRLGNPKVDLILISQSAMPFFPGRKHI